MHREDLFKLWSRFKLNFAELPLLEQAWILEALALNILVERAYCLGKANRPYDKSFAELFALGKLNGGSNE